MTFSYRLLCYSYSQNVVWSFFFRMTHCSLLWFLCVLKEHEVQILLLLKSMTKLPLTSAVQDQTLSNTANICFLAFFPIFQWKILEQVRPKYIRKKVNTINRLFRSIPPKKPQRNKKATPNKQTHKKSNCLLYCFT